MAAKSILGSPKNGAMYAITVIMIVAKNPAMMALQGLEFCIRAPTTWKVQIPCHDRPK
jgi:hypothetical protein